MARVRDIHYKASKTLIELHKSDAFVRGIMGPVGSGKSVGCCAEIFRRANEQAPGPDGFRRSRWAIVRNTYKELKSTTAKTWEDWFRPFGEMKQSDFVFHIDHLDVKAEVIFLALDKPEDIARLLSLELTGAFVNEAREIPLAVIEMLQLRVGRYPSKRDGGPTWYGVVMDTNPPDSDHWWYNVFEEQCPHNWQLFKQPSGISPEAENIQNLPDGYYTDMMSMQGEDWLSVYRDGKYGFVRDGKPVYPEYNDRIHCADLEIMPSQQLYIGIDFGLTPAALFGQKDAMGNWRFIDELVTFDMGALEFGEILKRKINEQYAGFKLTITGDPAGTQQAQTDKKTPFQMLSASGIAANPASTNDFSIRREAIALPLRRMNGGEPGFLLDGRRCPTFRKGMGGGYNYKRKQVSGDERYHDVPDKGKYSHICEAGQYCALGGGEGSNVLRSAFIDQGRSPVIQASKPFNLYG